MSWVSPVFQDDSDSFQMPPPRVPKQKKATSSNTSSLITSANYPHSLTGALMQAKGVSVSGELLVECLGSISNPIAN